MTYLKRHYAKITKITILLIIQLIYSVVEHSYHIHSISS